MLDGPGLKGLVSEVTKQMLDTVLIGNVEGFFGQKVIN